MQELRVPYLECSALTRKGLEEVFNAGMTLVLEKRKLIKKQS